MSISVDDLVASFNSNHIGQEALDLAALQAQLSQTLNSFASTQQDIDSGHQPCNTPTACTPSSSFGSWSHMPHRRKTSVASMNSHMGREDNIDEMEEDERMVEDLLWPSSPSTSLSSGSTANHQNHQSAFASYQPISSSSSSSSTKHRLSQTINTTAPNFGALYTTEPSSVFTTTDPFYMAQVQAAQSAASNVNVHSFFAQAGRPAQHSPFVMAQQMHRQRPSVDTSSHSLLASFR